MMKNDSRLISGFVSLDLIVYLHCANPPGIGRILIVMGCAAVHVVHLKDSEADHRHLHPIV